MATHINQPKVGGSSRGDVGGKACRGKSIWEGAVPSIGASIGTTKIQINKLSDCLIGLPITDDIHNNHPKNS